MRMAIHCVAANALLFRDIPWVAAADLKAIRLWSSMPAVTKRKPNSLRRTPATVFTCPRLAADKLTTTLTCIIHVVEGAKSLLCYKHVVKTVFEATKEASA